MDDIVITYLLYAISLVLFISLLSYSVLNYKASAQNVTKSSYDLQAAREDYNLGAYTSDGYYISGKSVNNLMVSGKAIILCDDYDTYSWVFKDKILNGYSNISLRDVLLGSTKEVRITSESLSQISEDEVYQLNTYTANIQGTSVTIYIIK